MIQSAKEKAKEQGFELLVSPVDLDLTFAFGGKTVRVDQMTGYGKFAERWFVFGHLEPAKL
ncbi:hypothetical protein ACU063_15250 [Paenibacillus sp. M.A.Huq-81]